ncbi:MAG: hypothetical protein JXA07_06830 [Spirochaetes bacterium]|nr:hypothetical protein [Spirochaetota bacterium]
MKKEMRTSGVKFRERVFSFIAVIRTIPFLFLAGFFLILKVKGVFDFEASADSIYQLYDMGEEYALEFLLPIVVIFAIVFYLNHKRIKQKSYPIRHLRRNTDTVKAEKMEKLRIKRAVQLALYELKMAAINTLMLLVSAAVITLFIISLLDKSRDADIPISVISCLLFAIFGIAFWTINRLRNILENSELWDIMCKSFQERLSGLNLINHGLLRGNEALIRWLDSFVAEAVTVNFAHKGMGFALETKGIQAYLFVDCASASILHIYIAAVLPDAVDCKGDELRKFTDYMKDWDFDITLFSEGISIRGTEDRIFSLLKDYREYEDDATMLVDIFERILKEIQLLGGQPGPYYSSFINE